MEEVIYTNALNDSTDCMHTEDKREWRPDLKLLEMLIQKIIEKLEQNSYEPRVQDALKAIQLREKLVKKSEAEEIFWQQIDDIRDSELEKLERLKNNPKDLQAQILLTLTRLQYEVKNGLLPVKTITDAFNRERSKECHLTYQRIGRLLSKMGFQKGRAGNNSAILWDEDMIDRMLEIPPFDRLRVVTVRPCSPSLSEVEGSEVEPPEPEKEISSSE